MPEERFPPFRAHLARHYARDKVDAGTWSPGEALGRAEGELAGLLPDGTATKGHHLYEITDPSTSEVVGTLWLAVQEGGAGRAVWIYDIEIFAPHRRMGGSPLAESASRSSIALPRSPVARASTKWKMFDCTSGGQRRSTSSRVAVPSPT